MGLTVTTHSVVNGYGDRRITIWRVSGPECPPLTIGSSMWWLSSTGRHNLTLSDLSQPITPHILQLSRLVMCEWLMGVPPQSQRSGPNSSIGISPSPLESTNGWGVWFTNGLVAWGMNVHAGVCACTGQRLLGIVRLENRLRWLMALPLLHQTQPSRLRRWGRSAFRAC